MRAPTRPPQGFEPVQFARGFGFVRPDARPALEPALALASPLAQTARAWLDVIDLGGRGRIVAARPAAHETQRWVVRPYLRGGLIGWFNTDLHLAVGRPRPWIEAQAIGALATAGVPTVEVIAGLVYPAARRRWFGGALYRAELVTRYVPDPRELADLLFGADHLTDASERQALLLRAGSTCRAIAEAGVWHRDLNARNLLGLHHEAEVLRVLDLDRAVVGVHANTAVTRMTSRLARSLRKFETASGLRLSAEEWRAFEAGAARSRR